MTDRELLELIAAQVGTLTKDVSELKGGMSGLKGDVSGLKEGQTNLKDEFADLKRIVLDLENDHGKKLTLLLDRYKQNADTLDRIEKEVSKHEEIIFRRVK